MAISVQRYSLNMSALASDTSKSQAGRLVHLPRRVKEPKVDPTDQLTRALGYLSGSSVPGLTQCLTSTKVLQLMGQLSRQHVQGGHDACRQTKVCP